MLQQRLLRVSRHFSFPNTTNLGDVLGELLSPDDVIPQEFYKDDSGHVFGGAVTKDSIILWRVDVETCRIWHFSNLKTILLPFSELTDRTIEDMLDEAWQNGAWD